jgi:5'-methylthioadenosine phosphorylase
MTPDDARVADAVPTVLGILGGSDLYDIPELRGAAWRRIKTPWGEPSDELLFGTVLGLPVVFLPRHGRHHRIPPSRINYRANIDALKRAGVTDLLSFSACGSLRENFAPGEFVIVDQFIDRTFAREKSFFDSGCVAHVAFGQPVSPLLGRMLDEAAQALGIVSHRGGTYLAMEGPQFSTLAESRLYRSWGCAVIGMTNMPEAKLAREAELPYATVGMVTDYDNWHDDHGAVDVSKIIETMHANSAAARRLIVRFAETFPREHPPCPIGSDRALEFAIITQPAARDPALMAKLEAMTGRLFATQPSSG